MGYLLKKSSTTRPILFLLVSASDHITGLTGATPTVTISKAGASFASPSGTVTEIANGWYQVAANATDTNTNGPLLLHATATGSDPLDDRFEVVSFDPDSATNLGLSGLPTASPAAAGGLPTVGTGTGQINPTSGGVDVQTIKGTSQTAGDLAGLLTNGSYGLSALLTAINNINNLSALATITGPAVMEIPASGSIVYPFTMLVKDEEGHLLDLSANPTITAANGAGTDRSSNLSSVSHPATGQYTFTYTMASSATQEGLSLKGSGTASSDSTARVAYFSSAAVAVDTQSTLATIVAQTNKLTFDGSNNVKSTPQTAVILTSAYDAAKTAATQSSVNAIPTNPLTTLGANAPAGWINAASINADAQVNLLNELTQGTGGGATKINVDATGAVASQGGTGGGGNTIILTPFPVNIQGGSSNVATVIITPSFSGTGNAGTTYTITYTSAYTDGTPVTLSTVPSGGYGTTPFIVRQDTGASVTGSAFALRAGTLATYDATFTAPASGLAYAITAACTVYGTTSVIPFNISGAISAAGAGQCRVSFPAYNGQGYPNSSAQVTFTLTSAPSTYGGFDKTVTCQINPVTAQPIDPTDGKDGCVLLASATYSVTVDGGVTGTFTTPSSGTYTIPLTLLGGG